MRIFFTMAFLLSFTGCKSKCEKMCECQLSKRYKEGPKQHAAPPAALAQNNKLMKTCVEACEKNPEANCEADKECCK